MYKSSLNKVILDKNNSQIYLLNYLLHPKDDQEPLHLH